MFKTFNQIKQVLETAQNVVEFDNNKNGVSDVQEAVDLCKSAVQQYETLKQTKEFQTLHNTIMHLEELFGANLEVLKKKIGL